MMNENAAPEHDTDNMDEAAVNEALGKMAAGEEVSTQPEEPTPQIADVPENQEADIEDAPKPEEGEEKGKGKSEFVPHKTFHFANEKRKAAEAELKTERESRARLEERLNIILAAQQPAPTPQANAEDQIPDPMTQPMEYLQWDRQQKIDAAKAARETEAQTKQQTEEQQYVQSVFDESVAEFQATAAAEPDLPTMYQGVWNSYINELRAARVPENQLVERAQDLERQHMVYAKQLGVPIVEYLKGIAKARNISITPPAPTPPVNDPARDAEGKFTAAQNREKAKQAGTSLGNSGGAVANMGGLTIENVLSMDDAEFRAYMDTNGGSLRKAYGV